MCAEFSAGLPRSFCLRPFPDTQECSVFISPPIHFRVFQGWGDAHGKEKTKLGQYVYDHEGTALQNFPVQVTFFYFLFPHIFRPLTSFYFAMYAPSKQQNKHSVSQLVVNQVETEKHSRAVYKKTTTWETK